ncbi:MAG: pyridoxal 5'-phosphate synthase glutaminase subunit PdxT [Acidimicrobiales bacterium]
MRAAPRVGVLALQGASAAHLEVLRRLGADAQAVRLPADLDSVDALVIPGGESTTIFKLMVSSGLFESVALRLGEGMPALGTCAGMILLAGEVLDGEPGQKSLGSIDISVRRNAYGRQPQSFETDLEIAGMTGGVFPGIFIRAPVVERLGEGVEVLASLGTQPILCRQGPILVAAFHPELSGDPRLHRCFLNCFT